MKTKLHQFFVANALLILSATVLFSSANFALATNTSAHTSLVQADSVDMPDVLDGQVEAVAVVGNRVVVGGSFTQVQGLDGTVHDQPYLFAFDQASGIVDTDFDPVLNKPVLALAASPDGQQVFVGGTFTSVNGLINKKGFTKLAMNGDKVAGFSGRTNGVVRDMVVDGNVVYIVGRFTKVGPNAREHFAAVDATTGQALSLVNSVFAGEYSSARVTGSLSVDDIDLTPDGSTAVIVGNFSLVDGQSRSRLAVFDLTGATATLSSWNTDVFYAECPASRFPQYIKGLDVSPDGRYFVTGTTGFWRVGEPACDTVARFELDTLDSNVQPTWFAHTGGDSVYEVAISGEAVYAGGHFRKFNNEFSPDGGKTAGPGGVDRLGMVALDPLNGLPLDWRADRSPRGLGTFELLIDNGGLWIGDDTEYINGQYHGRLKYLPIDTLKTVDRSAEPVLPTTLFRTNRTTGSLQALRFDGVNLGSANSLATTGWELARGAVVLGGKLFYGSEDGAVFASPVSDADVGNRVKINLNGLTTSQFPMDQMGGMYFDHDQGRLYYTIMGDDRLFFRHFTPSTPIFGDRQFEIADSTAVPWAQVRGMDRIGDHLYYGHGNGNLYRITLAGTEPVAGTTVAVSGPAIDARNWSDGTLAFFAGGELTLPSEPDSSIVAPLKAQMFNDSTITVTGAAFAGNGVGAVAVAVRNTDTGEWLRADGTYGNFQWLNAMVDEPGLTQTSWHLDLELSIGSWTVIARASDVNGVVEKDRPNTSFVINNWVQVNGGLVTASMGADGSFWGVNKGGTAYKRTGVDGRWRAVIADVSQIDAQSYSQALATDVEGRIHYFNGTSWTVIPGSLVYPSMGIDGSLWGVNQFGSVYRRTNTATSWTRIPGPVMVKIDALNFEQAVALDANGQVYHFNRTAWRTIDAPAMSAISYGADGSLWGINLDGEAFRAISVGSPWEQSFIGLALIDIDAQNHDNALGTTESSHILFTDDPLGTRASDDQAPTVTISSPESGEIVSPAAFNLEALVTDNVGVTDATVAVQDADTGLWLQSDNGVMGSIRRDLPADLSAANAATADITFEAVLNPGSRYSVVVVASDEASNASEEVVVAFETSGIAVREGNLVTNGSFEDLVWNGATHVQPTGWVLGGTPSAGGLHRNPARATDGEQYVALGGWGNTVGATLSQQVSVELDARYRLSYDLSSNWGRVNQTVRVEVIDQAGSVIYTEDTTSPAGEVNRFRHEFDATFETITIRFTHIEGVGGDADFDNVKLVQNRVANGSFENVIWSGVAHEQPAAWVLAGTPQAGGLHRNFLRASDGQQYVPLGGWSSRTGATLSQVIPVTAGQSYDIAYDLSSFYGAVSQGVRVEVLDTGGALLLSSDSVVQANESRTFEHTFTATWDSVTLRFTHIEGAGGDADFDNVRVFGR